MKIIIKLIQSTLIRSWKQNYLDKTNFWLMSWWLIVSGNKKCWVVSNSCTWDVFRVIWMHTKDKKLRKSNSNAWPRNNQECICNTQIGSIKIYRFTEKELHLTLIWKWGHSLIHRKNTKFRGSFPRTPNLIKISWRLYTAYITDHVHCKLG
jgi:hypothetical protein